MTRKLITLLFLILLLNNLFGSENKIFSTGSSSKETLSLFLSHGNSDLGDELIEEFATIYIEESTLEGINWDVAFVQMCLETGFLKYGGLVEVGQNNFCGLGSFGDAQGASFPTIRDGVKAHIQHLKAYSSTEDLNGELLDPRFHLVKRGSATSVEDLAGKWAEDPKYGVKLTSLLKRVHLIESREIILKAEVPETTLGAGSNPPPKDISEIRVDYLTGDVYKKRVDDDVKEGEGWLR